MGPVLDPIPGHTTGLVLLLNGILRTGRRSELHLALVLSHNRRHLTFLAADSVLEHLFLTIILQLVGQLYLVHDLLAGNLFLACSLLDPIPLCSSGSLTLRPCGHCKRRDEDQDKDGTKRYLPYHCFRLLSIRVRDDVRPASPVSTIPSAGIIKPFLKQKAT
jgi:hypothetical protein